MLWREGFCSIHLLAKKGILNSLAVCLHTRKIDVKIYQEPLSYSQVVSNQIEWKAFKNGGLHLWNIQMQNVYPQKLMKYRKNYKCNRISDLWM